MLPIFGALPDSMLVLFSGVGENPKQEIEVGVGTLAGSTIMLLTVPWFFSNLGGRVDIQNGKALYKKKPRKLTQGLCACRQTGSEPGPSVKIGGALVGITTLPYLIV